MIDAQGLWVADDEHIATFVFRLEEAIRIPDKYHLRDIRPAHPKLVKKLLDAGYDSPANRERVINLERNGPSPKFLISSCRIHQKSVPFEQRVLLKRHLDDLKVAVPPEELGAESSAPLPELAQVPITLVEIAVPLTITHLLALNDCEPNERVIPLGERALDDATLRQALGAALRAVRVLQDGYEGLTGEALSSIRAPMLGPLIPCLVRTQEQIFRGGMDGILSIIQNDTPRPMGSPEPPLDESALRGLPLSAGRSGTALRGYQELESEARSALFARSDTRMCVASLASASESFLNTLIAFLQWEECCTPEASAGNWRSGLNARVNCEIKPRLGGDWSFEGDGPVARWHKHVSQVRHRVVHAGYEPSREEATQAIEALHNLVTFVGDRLSSNRCRNKYPRVTLTLYGIDAVKRRGVSTRRLSALLADPTEPSWQNLFERWVLIQRCILRGDERRPEESPHSLVALILPDRTIKFVMHNPKFELAREVELSGELPGFDVDKILSQVAPAGWPDLGPAGNWPIQVEVEGGVTPRCKPLGPWMESYRYLPAKCVMRDGSDLNGLVLPLNPDAVAGR